jgi:hypothetical protein
MPNLARGQTPVVLSRLTENERDKPRMLSRQAVPGLSEGDTAQYKTDTK